MTPYGAVSRGHGSLNASYVRKSLVEQGVLSLTLSLVVISLIIYIGIRYFLWCVSDRAEMLVQENMANVVVFQSKLSSVMDMLAKAAIAEISRLWDDAFAFVQLEVRQREHEIESLRSKVLMMETERLEILSRTAPSAPSLSTTRQPNNVLRKAPVNDGNVPRLVLLLSHTYSDSN